MSKIQGYWENNAAGNKYCKRPVDALRKIKQLDHSD